MKNKKQTKVVAKATKIKKIDYSKRTMAEAIAASATESRKFRI
tara:strand:+ start:504 stop:632 length:129 start_codon:yes stop_codon:yes gene_type:complete